MWLPVPGATCQVIETLHTGSGTQVGATGRWAVTKPKGFGRGCFIHGEGKAVLSRFACSTGGAGAQMRTRKGRRDIARLNCAANARVVLRSRLEDEARGQLGRIRKEAPQLAAI